MPVFRIVVTSLAAGLALASLAGGAESSLEGTDGRAATPFAAAARSGVHALPGADAARSGVRALPGETPARIERGTDGLERLITNEPSTLSGRFVRDGVAVELTLDGASVSGGLPAAGEPARVRFAITDVTSGKPLSGVHPAAWLSRKTPADAALRPQTAAEKVRELLGGSLFAQADVDLNTFRVVVLNDDATISAVDPNFGTGRTRRLSTITLPGPGEDWALATDAQRLYVTVPDARKIAAIDTSTWSLKALLDSEAPPRRIALQPDGYYVWAAGSDDHAPERDGVTAIVSAAGTIAARIPTGRGPHQLAFSADSRWAFVVNAGARTLSVIDVHTLRRAKDVPLGCSPVAAAYSSLSDTVLLTDPASGNVIVFDATKHEIVTRIPTGPGIREIKFTPGGRYALIAVPTRNVVLVVDAATNRIVQQAEIEDGPERFAFSSDMVFVISRGSATIHLLPLAEIGREGHPVAVADFAGGDHSFGPAASLADTVVPVPGEPAVVVANPSDRAIYYYMEGMAAPMGNFSNGERRPKGVLTLDCSLRERAPGLYETSATLPASGAYDLVFFLDSPRVAHCFDVTIRPATVKNAGPQRTQSSDTEFTERNPSFQTKTRFCTTDRFASNPIHTLWPPAASVSEPSRQARATEHVEGSASSVAMVWVGLVMKQLSRP